MGWAKPMQPTPIPDRLIPEGVYEMGIVSRPITPTPPPLNRNPRRLHSIRWYLLRRGRYGRSLRNSYRG